MYEIIKSVIESRNYELSDILFKIEKRCFENLITEEQRDTLKAMARENADPKNSYVALEKQVDSLFTNISKLEQELVDVRTRLAELEGGEVEPEVPTDEYPEYVQPTGAHDAYKIGDKVTYKGKKYECLKDGCVWTPDDYPQGWKLIEDVVEDEGVPEEETE